MLCEYGWMDRKVCWYFVGAIEMEGHSAQVDYADRIFRVDKQSAGSPQFLYACKE